MIAIDSTEFIYVLEQNEDFYVEALKLLRLVESGKIAGVASELVYLEVLSDRTLIDERLMRARRFLATTQVKYFSVNRDILFEAARLRRDYQNLKAPDAIHLATAFTRDCDYFVTNDASLLKLKLPELKIATAQAVNRLLVEDDEA